MTTTFTAWTGRFLCAEAGGGVVADRVEAREWETWAVEPQADGTVALRSAHGTYLCAELDYAVTHRTPGTADGAPGPWECWTQVLHASKPIVALRSAHGRYLCVEADGRVVADRLEIGEWELFGVVPWWQTIPAPPTLSVIGRWFQADGVDFDYREASAMALFHRITAGEDVSGDFAVWRALGFTHLRLFGMLLSPWWERKGIHYGPTVDPDFYERTAALFDRIAAEGFGVRYAIFCDAQHLGMSRTAHLERLAPILAARPWVIAEVANEPSINGFDVADGELMRYVRILRDRGVRLVAAGAAHGADGHQTLFALPPATYVSFHAERQTGEDGWAWIRRLGEYPVIQNGAALPALSGEPINAGDRGNPGDYQADTAIWFAYGALSRLVPTAGYLPCLHSDLGLYGFAPAGNTLACAAAFKAGCDAVPISTRRLGWTNGHHAASPWAGYWQTDPPQDDRPVRIYGRGDAFSGYVGLALRSPRGWTWRDLRYPVRSVVAAGDGRFVAELFKGGR